MALFVRLLQDEEGATIVEYALCLATFSLVTIAGMYALVTGANGAYSAQTGAMNTYQVNGP
ncbi:MAG: Flp family type IVb pilin [Vulcanimicrobiaceae bacterium]